MNSANTYLEQLMDLLHEVLDEEMEAMERVARRCCQAIQEEGMLYAFGTGHSHMLAEEIFYRAGGLVRVCPILDSALMLHEGAAKSTSLERLEGYAELLLRHYDVQPKDVMFIFSNAGRNAATVEMALEARKRGIPVVAITNKKHSDSAASRHSSGKKLCDVADIVIDNHGCIGDASVEIGGERVGPTSTAVGAAILQAIVCRIVELCHENHMEVEVFASSNVDYGDEINQQHIQKYRNQIKPLW